ncbi:ABC transporter ATP-binding protein [Paraburkholderia caballeronis]|uniref:ABC transporter ATP-binding protein n=1 Tax=Paraburkholderia caballeronis TaxID=416943 RepID=UPI0010660C6B|nr:ABC transporter ATP-binding protein [Paraburkholderia caballeronis]TDV15666.1 multiple sugar transport system ATP-binding protein [Paraburkholderia caballeronis]TDV17921.1 multiple sugar transport system ATP-binding protein [Paraburkholderia caballeronis]TDV26465.1 multiple sugar transport system ATP-binding protein [Paraburkholderia caballeronis]TDV33621.1 multiple sugar transport system ATP-binding protein [Paraburkholderia caballeronis]
MAAVSFRQVHKAFGDTVTIPSLDLDIADGEFVSLLGPSGCGKTTTLRMLAGLEQPTRGTIEIGGREVQTLPPAQRDIAMVFQSYALYPHLSVAENIVYPLRKRGVPKQQWPALLQQVVQLLQLEPLLARKPKQLSGGQQQRVALGRALIRNPKVFLLDEPLSNLDAKLRAHMRAELIELHQRIGTTTVYVTHDQLEAMTMSTRIAVMNGGVLQQFAAPDEIYYRPANLFVAGFIGTPAMSLADATLIRADDGFVVSAGGLSLRLPAAALSLHAPREVVLGLRPEDVVLGAGPWHARVKVVEPTGHESIVLLDCGGVALVARVASDLPLAAELRAGDDVPFDVSLSRAHVFARDSGARLNRDEANVTALRRTRDAA